jgi:hypothetical protein
MALEIVFFYALIGGNKKNGVIMNKIINQLDMDIGPHRNDFACIDCKHSHWYTGCSGPTIHDNNEAIKNYESIKSKSKYSPEDFLACEGEKILMHIEASYEKEVEAFKSMTTLEQYKAKFTKADHLRIASRYLDEYKKFVQEGPRTQPENIVLVCYCKALYKETFHTSIQDRDYFHITACEAKPGLLKEE